ncbi:MAG: class I SAM-dependent methyltransferase [Acidobacteriia bacterium]|nr:class I SAM-dependent methyltransferase [Terriglobia bacterium]
MRLAGIPVIFAAAVGVLAADRAFTSYASVKRVLEAQRERLPAELRNADDAKWSAWSRRQDQTIRARLEQGDLDSLVNLLLFGTSFTKQSRIKVEEITQASKSGALRARVDDLVAGMRSPGGNERLVFLNGLLRRKGIDLGSSATGVFIYNNLERVLQERKTLAERAAEAKRTNLPDLDRASLFSDRGVSLDTSILPDFSIEQTLRDLKKRGMLREGQVARVAVVGPGLDFIDKNDESGYDYYPQQTVQPFALYDSLVRLKLARANALSLSILDISQRVIDHIQRARERARKNTGYVIQLPRDVSRPWPPELVSYWSSLGDQVGTAVMPVRPPEIFQSLNGGQGLETRAVRIRPDAVLACQPTDLNIVLERIDLTAANRFDLVIGTNIFVYYDSFEQTLALENAGAMLKPGGLLLSNDRLPEVPGGSMRLAGTTEVRYDDRGAREVVGWYQAR